MGAVTHPIDRAGIAFLRGTGRFFLEKGVHIVSFRCFSEETLTYFWANVSRRPVVVLVFYEDTFSEMEIGREWVRREKSLQIEGLLERVRDRP